MGRAPCCDKSKVKRGPWSPEEDTTLRNYVNKHGTAAGSWIALPQKAGLKRCGKSCRLRWLNYLRPNIKHGGFTQQEDSLILSLYHTIGSRWSVIASQLPGRTDNDVKNYWNTKLKKKLFFTAGATYYNPLSASLSAPAPATTSSFISSTNSDVDDVIDNMLPYFPVDVIDSYHGILDSQIPPPALVESPENDFALLPAAPATLFQPFSAANINANGSRNGSCGDDDPLLLEFGSGLMPYDFYEKFNQEINHLGFGYSPSNISNAAQEQQTIYQSFTY